MHICIYIYIYMYFVDCRGINCDVLPWNQCVCMHAHVCTNTCISIYIHIYVNVCVYIYI